MTHLRNNRLKICSYNLLNSILIDFFEERAEDVTDRILARWVDKHQEMEDLHKRETDISTKLLTKSLEKVTLNQKRIAFNCLQNNIEATNQEEFKSQLEKEKEARIIIEASMAALQVDLREALAQIKVFEKKEKKRLDRKKKNINMKRQEMLLGEEMRTLSIEKSRMKSEPDEGEELDLEEALLSSREKPNQLVETQPKRKRRHFLKDQRGSVNTEIRQNRMRSNLFSRKGSLSVASSVSRGGQSQFSFHPSINFTSSWKPKYDDHHDHKKMVKRMHREMEVIQAKKRIASEHRKLEEIAQCTFKPNLVAKPTKSSLYRISKSTTNLIPDSDKNDPASTKELSSRLYKYAEKLKENKELK